MTARLRRKPVSCREGMTRSKGLAPDGQTISERKVAAAYGLRIRVHAVHRLQTQPLAIEISHVLCCTAQRTQPLSQLHTATLLCGFNISLVRDNLRQWVDGKANLLRAARQTNPRGSLVPRGNLKRANIDGRLEQRSAHYHVSRTMHV